MAKPAVSKPATLDRYHAKRDFKKTSEPEGAEASTNEFTYIIQKHDASHLHFDFRLQLDGTLKSWAVPKGPSYDPHDKRLAMQVEDHPVDYATFEGTIPQGEYGGGTVMLWDRGTWEPVGDPRAGLQDGKLVFQLHGERLQGEWTLVRTHGATSSHGHGNDGKQWLLLKHRDDFVREGDAGAFVAEQLTSVASGRTMAEIAAGDAVAAKTPTHDGSTKSKPTSRTRLHKRPVALPGFIEPQLATLSDAMPRGTEWVHEVKFDGYRMLAYVEGDSVKMISRNKKDWTKTFSHVVDALSEAKVANAVFDGEVVCMDDNFRSDFSRLKNAISDGRSDKMQYFAFDLLFLDGEDLRGQPLHERKAKLRAVVEQMTAKAKQVVRFSEEFDDRSGQFFKSVCSMQLEGVISKRADAPYVSGRGKTWIKTKCVKREEFVIGGFTLPSNGSNGIGALLLGYYEADAFYYAGRVGTGWNSATSISLRNILGELNVSGCPFSKIDAAARRGATWVDPKVVCEVQFAEWTPDGHLRHGSFQGVREDKAAKDVGREKPVPLHRVDGHNRDTSVKKAPVTATDSARSKASGTEAFVQSVRISHPERIIFPKTSITKRQLAEFYASIADRLLPHIVDRPLSVMRCPNGAGETCFFQRHLGLGTSTHLHELVVPIKGKNEEYMRIDDVQGLLALIQWGVIELHPWQCRTKHLDKPDRLIFDLDPGSDVPWTAVCDGARELRARMRELGLECFVKTTGGKGLHVVVPMTPTYDWDVIKSFARLVAQSMETDSPKKYLSRMTKAARTGRIYVDYLRNENTATAVSPFSVRARPGAPVSMTLSWKDLSAKLDPQAFTVETAAARINKSDPWSEFFELKQKLLKKHLKVLRLVD